MIRNSNLGQGKKNSPIDEAFPLLTFNLFNWSPPRHSERKRQAKPKTKKYKERWSGFASAKNKTNKSEKKSAMLGECCVAQKPFQMRKYIHNYPLNSCPHLLPIHKQVSNTLSLPN